MRRLALALFLAAGFVSEAAATGMTVTGTIAGVPINVLTTGGGATPAVSSCGTSPTLTLGATDASFRVIPGAGATSCVITLGGSYGAQLSAIVAAEDNTAITWTWAVTSTAAATWDPTHVGPGINLFNGNLGAQPAGTDCTISYPAVRTANSYGSGKYYFEVGFYNGALDPNTAIGLGNSSMTFVGSPGGSDPGWTAGVIGGNPLWSFQGTNGTAATTFHNGDVVGIAVDVTNKLAWQIVMPGAGGHSNWNNNPSANPATGVGGQPLTVMAPPYFAAAWLNPCASTVPSALLNVGPYFTLVGAGGTMPSGYLGWNGSAPAPLLTGAWDPVNRGFYVHVTAGNPSVYVDFNIAGANYQGARTTTSHASGKYYYECAFYSDGMGGTNPANLVVGIVNGSADLGQASGGVSFGVDTNSIAIYGTLTNWFFNNATTSTGASGGFQQGDTVGIAVDTTAKKVWQIYMHGSSISQWNASPTADPATGVGGQDLSGVTGPYFAMCAGNAAANATYSGWTANFGYPAYQIVTNGGVVPAGFGNW